MILKEAIERTQDSLPIPFIIEVRCTIPKAEIYDELFGFACWNGRELLSLDGDTYSLEDEIIHYEIADDIHGGKLLSVTEFEDTATDIDITQEIQSAQDALGPPKESELESELYLDMTSSETETPHRSRAERRKKDYAKARRKQNICADYYGWEFYDNLHEYSKGKIHCSCPMCSSKTNTKKWRGKSHAGLYMHWGSSNERYERNYKPSDKRKIDMLKEREQEYVSKDTVTSNM